MTNIVLVTGYAQHGKDSIADRLVAKHGYVKLKFAQPLYDGLVAMFAPLYAAQGITLTSEFIEKNKTAKVLGFNSEFDITWRRALQTIGTEWGRTFVDPMVWIEVLLSKLDTDINYVVSDCRFNNEFRGVRRNLPNDFTMELWAVTRRLESAAPDLTHRSEQEMESLISMSDVIFTNDDTLEQLHKQIDAQIADDK